MNIPAIAVHGGSGTIPSANLKPDTRKKYLNALEKALEIGFKNLTEGASALDGVTKTVSVLENCELFNAGRGSVFTVKGTHEMDAAVMDGKDLKAGAVAGIQGIKNPVFLAKHILQNSSHVFLAGKEAMEYARRQNFEFMPDSYFFTQYRYDQWQQIKGSDEVKLDHSGGNSFETVGAVAVDVNRNVAAATSTGGMTNKAWGRIGDSPVIGAGTYAHNNSCAVSCTGHGEYFIRGVIAHDVSCRMEYKGLSLKHAAQEAIHKRLKKINGEGGLIAIDSTGNISMPFNTEGMYRGMKNSREIVTEIFK